MMFWPFRKKKPKPAEVGIEISGAAFDELAQKLLACGEHDELATDVIVFGRVWLWRSRDEQQPSHPAHRPIAPGVGQKRKKR